MAEVKLRPGWQWVKFGDVVKLNKETTKDPLADGLDRYIGLEHLEPGDLRIRSFGNVADGTTFTNRFRPGQVLFGKRRAYQRKVAVAEFEGVCSGDIYVLETKDPKILLPDLLPFICQTDGFFEHAIGTSAGSLSPRTNWRSLADYELALPPLKEQHRLLSICATSMRNIEDAQELVGTAELAKLAFIDYCVERWLGRRSGVPLKSVLRDSPESGYSAPPSSKHTGHWVLALSALSRIGYVPDELKPVEPTEKMLAATLSQGDLLISRSNTLERVGFVGRYHDENQRTVSFPDTMMRLRPNPQLLTAEILEMILQSTNLRKQIMAIAAGTSASMKKINKANLLRLVVPVPTTGEREVSANVRVQMNLALTSARLRLQSARMLHASLLDRFLNSERNDA